MPDTRWPAGIDSPPPEHDMPWIHWIDEPEATGPLRKIYERLTTDEGLDHILKIHSLNPRSLDDHHRLYVHLMRGPSALSRVEREMIAVAVSKANECFY